MITKSSRLLTSTPHQTRTQAQTQPPYEEEFDECDVVWSSSYDSSPTSTSTSTTPSAVETTVIYPSAASGLSTALLSTVGPKSPSSIQRKTTSSPVSMISSSSLGRPDGPGSFLYGRKSNQSAPVNVPVWPAGIGRSRAGFLGPFDESDDFQDEGEMIPPHEIVARSHNSNASSFSVFEGAGRKLKGRDLTTVRNSVFQKTGFL